MRFVLWMICCAFINGRVLHILVTHGGMEKNRALDGHPAEGGGGGACIMSFFSMHRHGCNRNPETRQKLCGAVQWYHAAMV